MRFLFDEHIAPRLVRALSELAAGEPYAVQHLRDRFPHGTTDVTWLGDLAAEGGWAFVSEDRRIRRRPHELAALRESRLIGFFLAKGWNQEGLWGHAALLIGWWPAIVATAAQAKPGQMFEVPHRRTTAPLKPLL